MNWNRIQTLFMSLVCFGYLAASPITSVGQESPDDNSFAPTLSKHYGLVAAVDHDFASLPTLESVGEDLSGQSPVQLANHTTEAATFPVENYQPTEQVVHTAQSTTDQFDRIGHGQLVDQRQTAGTWRERMRNHFWDASANAVTSGWTASIFGGPGLRPSYFDGFGRTEADPTVNGGVIGFAFGKRLNVNRRREIEFSWRNRDFQFSSSTRSIELGTFAGMFNSYYDFDRGPGKIITPYIGGGLGVSHEDVSAGFYTADKTAFTLQSMVGFSIHLSRQNEFFFEGRSFSRYSRNSGNFNQRTSNDLIFGLRHTF